MNLNKLIVGVALALVLAVVVGLVVDNVGFWVVVGLLILALLSMFVDRFVYIRVGEMETAVLDNMNEGMSFGVNGTPTFFINGILVSGALPYESFEQGLNGMLVDLKSK